MFPGVEGVICVVGVEFALVALMEGHGCDAVSWDEYIVVGYRYVLRHRHLGAGVV